MIAALTRRRADQLIVEEYAERVADQPLRDLSKSVLPSPLKVSSDDSPCAWSISYVGAVVTCAPVSARVAPPLTVPVAGFQITTPGLAVGARAVERLDCPASSVPSISRMAGNRELRPVRGHAVHVSASSVDVRLAEVEQRRAADQVARLLRRHAGDLDGDAVAPFARDLRLRDAERVDAVLQQLLHGLHRLVRVAVRGQRGEVGLGQQVRPALQVQAQAHRVVADVDDRTLRDSR